MRQSLSHLAVALILASRSVSADDITMCGQHDKLVSSTGQYTFATNQWGADGSGVECVTISEEESVFNSTWKWTDNPDSVHSFPNINLNTKELPIQLSNLQALNVKASWTMEPSDPSKSQNLSAISASADVIVDMFFDPDRTTANSTTKPKYEVMVWLAEFGGKKPIGYSSSIQNPGKQKVGNYEFSLYEGANKNGQYVYSWLAPENINNINEDISPLIKYLWQQGKMDESVYLGIVQFGSEGFHSESNVTFSVRDYDLNVQSGSPTNKLVRSVRLRNT